MAFWSFAQMEAEIDRLALWGVNLPLAFVGQEATEDRVYRAAPFNLNSTELNDYIAGPAFLPWQRMGNMRKWGGPVTADWHAKTKAMQILIVTRMREFGMTPVLAGFAGHVPTALAAHFPASNFTKSSDWCGFDPVKYGADLLLQATDPLFMTLGTALNKATLEDFGDPTGLETPVFNAGQRYAGGRAGRARGLMRARCGRAARCPHTAAAPAAPRAPRRSTAR